jgi:hypothetical protein
MLPSVEQVEFGGVVIGRLPKTVSGRTMARPLAWQSDVPFTFMPPSAGAPMLPMRR